MPDKPKLSPEEQRQKAAETIDRMGEFLDQEYPTDREKLQAVAAGFDELKGLDIPKAMEDLEARQSKMERHVEQIRRSKGGLYVSGIEDEEFSLCRALIAVRKGRRKADWEAMGAAHEFDLLRQVYDKHADRYEHLRAKAQNVGDDELGGFFVPDQVIPDVIPAIYTHSAWINLDGESGDTRVSVLDGVTGGKITIPKVRGGCVAYWIGEEDEYAESAMKLGKITSDPKKLGVLVPLTEEMQQFGAYGFEAALRRDMVRAAAKKLDWTIAYGTGGNDMPRGITRHIGAAKAEDNIKVFNIATGDVIDPTTVTDWDPAEMDWVALSQMALVLEEDDIEMDSSFGMVTSPRYLNRLKNARLEYYSAQTSGRGYVLGPPTISDARLRDLLGFDVGKTTQIPSNAKPGAGIGGPTDNTDAKQTDVFMGNLSEVWVPRWAGLDITDDGGMGKGFTSDIIYQKLRLMVDVVVRQPRAIAVAPNVIARD